VNAAHRRALVSDLGASVVPSRCHCKRRPRSRLPRVQLERWASVKRVRKGGTVEGLVAPALGLSPASPGDRFSSTTTRPRALNHPPRVPLHSRRRKALRHSRDRSPNQHSSKQQRTRGTCRNQRPRAHIRGQTKYDGNGSPGQIFMGDAVPSERTFRPHALHRGHRRLG